MRCYSPAQVPPPAAGHVGATSVGSPAARGRVHDADIDEEVLERLARLRDAVLGAVGHAPDLDALRTLLRQLFQSVVCYPAGSGWLDAETIDRPLRDGEPSSLAALADGGVLIPMLNPPAIVGLVEDDPRYGDNGVVSYQRATLPEVVEVLNAIP